MQLPSLVIILCTLYTALAIIPMSVKVPANERVCYYVRAHREDAKIRASFTVMTGGQFDIDATLTRPDGTVAQGVKKSEGDEWLLSASQVGDYELCFYNEMSTFADKTVQFEYSVDTVSIEATAPKPANEDHTYEMEKYIIEIDQYASLMSRQLQYLKSRNARNEETVTSTASRVRWYTFIELFVFVSMAVCNVKIVQMFFKGSRRNVV